MGERIKIEPSPEEEKAKMEAKRKRKELLMKRRVIFSLIKLYLGRS